MSRSPGRRRRQLTPEEKWEVFLEVTSQQLTQADAARKWGVDVSVVIKLRRLAEDACLAAFAACKPARIASPEQAQIEALRGDNARLSEALKELAVELTLTRGYAGKGALGLNGGPLPARLAGEVKEGFLKIVDEAVAAGWVHTRACAPTAPSKTGRRAATRCTGCWAGRSRRSWI